MVHVMSHAMSHLISHMSCYESPDESQHDMLLDESAAGLKSGKEKGECNMCACKV